MKKDFFRISNKKFASRLIVGTGKYRNFTECAKAVKASGAEIVTDGRPVSAPTSRAMPPPREWPTKTTDTFCGIARTYSATSS